MIHPILVRSTMTTMTAMRRRVSVTERTCEKKEIQNNGCPGWNSALAVLVLEEWGGWDIQGHFIVFVFDIVGADSCWYACDIFFTCCRFSTEVMYASVFVPHDPGSTCGGGRWTYCATPIGKTRHCWLLTLPIPTPPPFDRIRPIGRTRRTITCIRDMCVP